MSSFSERGARFQRLAQGGSGFGVSLAALTDPPCHVLTNFSILAHVKMCLPLYSARASAQPGRLPNNGNIPTLIHHCQVTSLAGDGWEALGSSKDFRKTPSLSPSFRARCPGPLFSALRKQEFGIPHSAPYSCPTPPLSNAHPPSALLPMNPRPRTGHNTR